MNVFKPDINEVKALTVPKVASRDLQEDFEELKEGLIDRSASMAAECEYLLTSGDTISVTKLSELDEATIEATVDFAYDICYVLRSTANQQY